MRSFRRTRARAAGALVAALALLLSGCSEGDVPPREWANQVCQALGPWTEEISDLTQDTQTQMTQARSPKQAKKAIVGLLRGAEEASEEARRGIEVAGVPEVENGEKIAQQFRDALTGARDAYRKARQSVEKLSTEDADDFYDGVVTVMDTLNTDYRQTGVDPDKLASDELQEAFDEAPDCQ